MSSGPSATGNTPSLHLAYQPTAPDAPSSSTSTSTSATQSTFTTPPVQSAASRLLAYHPVHPTLPTQTSPGDAILNLAYNSIMKGKAATAGLTIPAYNERTVGVNVGTKSDIKACPIVTDLNQQMQSTLGAIKVRYQRPGATAPADIISLDKYLTEHHVQGAAAHIPVVLKVVASLLPALDTQGYVDFTPIIAHYDNELVVLITAYATSNRLLEKSGDYTNIGMDDGSKDINLRATRLADDRKRDGANLTAPLNKVEADCNRFVIVRIPLAPPPAPPAAYNSFQSGGHLYRSYEGGMRGGDSYAKGFLSAQSSSTRGAVRECSFMATRPVEMAQIQPGTQVGNVSTVTKTLYLDTTRKIEATAVLLRLVGDVNTITEQTFAELAKDREDEFMARAPRA